MNMVNYWICEIALLLSGFIYVHTLEPRVDMKKRFFAELVLFFIFTAIVNYLPLEELLWLEILMRTAGFFFLAHLMMGRRVLSLHCAIYYTIWAFMSWQLLYEIWMLVSSFYREIFRNYRIFGYLTEILIFAAGLSIVAFTIGKWMPDKGQKKIGPRQFTSAVLLFLVFQVLVLVPGNLVENLQDWRWAAIYASQLIIALILYLQNELFKKSDMRQELEMMNLLWQKEQEQYKLSRDTIALINQKCHDLKHQIRVIRDAGREEREQYLEEIEDSIQIYEAIVKTGNEVLDTILTEKSLYCKKKDIVVSCVVDGSQMDFIHKVDLYAILGNAIDNAMEAVEKFRHKEKRQIDVMIYRQQQLLVIHVVNPIKENLVYENELPVTTKENRQYHGYGLRSIRYLLKKYDGFLNIREEDGCFSLMMLIPIPKTT